MEEEIYFNEIGNEITDAIKSQMFGKPYYKLRKKAFTCFFKNCMVFKLNGEYHQETLSFDGSELFDPSGKDRPMKNGFKFLLNTKKNGKYLQKKQQNILQNKIVDYHQNVNMKNNWLVLYTNV